MNNWIKKPLNQLITFFVLAFLIAWGAWLPVLLLGAPVLISVIGLFGPAIAAIIVAALSGARQGVFQLLGRYKIWRFGAGWYAFAVFSVPILYLLAILSNAVFFNYSLVHVFTDSPLYFIVGAFIWLMVITSGEEIGWRGFALPLMLEKWTNIYGVSIVLGVIWGLWHLPLYLVPAQSSFPYPLFVIFTVAASVIYTVLFIKTKGSALPVVMLHAGTDVGARIFQIAYFTPTVWLTMDVLLLLVAVGMSLGRQSANKAVDII